MFARNVRLSKTFAIFVVCVAIFTDMTLAGLIVPILPYALLERVGLPQGEVQRWNSILLASHGGALMIGSLLLGCIGDRVPSRRGPFVLGLVFVGASTLGFALGKSLPILLVARTLQGLSSAVVFTAGYALLYDTVGKDGIGRAMGFTGLSLSFGLLLGPVVGGVLYEHCGYFQAFLPAFALIVGDILLRLMMVELKQTTYGPNVSESSTATSPPEGTCVHGALPSQFGGPTAQADTSAEAVSETEPLLRRPGPRYFGSSIPVLLRSGRFLTAIMSLFVLNSFTTGFDAVIPLYTHQVFGFNAMQAALLLLVLVVPMVLSPISGAVADRVGAKVPAACGCLVLIISLFFLRLIVPGIDSPFLKLAVVLFLIGSAVAIATPPLVAEVSSAVNDIEQAEPGIFGVYGAYSQAYGLMNTTVAAGSLIGPLDAGFIRDWLGWSTMSLFMILVSSITLILILSITGGHTPYSR